MVETRPEDLAWEKGRWYVKGDPEKGALIEEIATRAYSGEEMPSGLEGGLDAQVIYDPPNLTYPYGAYIAVVDIDPDTGHVTVRRFIAVDDCGVRINPMIVDGQIHGGLAEGVGIALMEVITFDEEGNCLNSSFMDYLIPTALECPDFELGETRSDIDPDTGHVTVRRFIAVDDCGVRINPMIVDGQIHGGLAEGVGIALMEVITFDEEGNCLNSSFMDYLIPTALE